MAEANDPKRCRAVAGNTGKQCKNARFPGSPYCWHHQAWRTTAIGLLISISLGAIVGFFVNILSAKYTEKVPKLVPSLNWQQLAADTVFVYPTNATYPSNAPWHDFTFWIQNAGDMDASEMFVRFTTHSYISNFIHAPKWNVEEVGNFGHTDDTLAALVQRADRPIPSPFGAKFQPFLVNSGKVPCFGGFLMYGAIGAETKKARIHVFFDNPAGVTNVFRDKAAREYLSKFDPGVAANAEAVIVKFILDSTNEVRVVRQGNPSARIEVVTDETNSGVIIFRTNVLR